MEILLNFFAVACAFCGNRRFDLPLFGRDTSPGNRNATDRVRFLIS